MMQNELCIILYCVVFVFLALTIGKLYIGWGRVDFFNPFIIRACPTDDLDVYPISIYVSCVVSLEKIVFESYVRSQKYD
jgi:hypothetical protein